MPYSVPAWIDWTPTEANANSIKAAKDAKLTPVKLDPDAGYAEFSSRHDNYRTTLEQCMTVTGKRCGGGFPCKHMYRLAMELSLIPGPVRSDPSKIEYQRQGISLEDAVQRAESVSTEAQRFLSANLRALRKGPLDKWSSRSDTIPELIAAGLLVRIDDPEEIRLHPDIDRNSYKLFTYLRRKFDHIDDELLRLDKTPEEAPFSPNPDNFAGRLALLLAKLSVMDGVAVQIKGAQTSLPMIWLSGDVSRHREKIEKLGGKWSEKRSAWYFSVGAAER